MGMIMKDGIQYGGIYPIDDAPTQGSNNAVKSGGVHSALSNKVDNDTVSDAYSASATYVVGDYCIYNNVLYKCNTTIATPEAFVPAKWDATTITNEVVGLSALIYRGYVGYVDIMSDGVKSYGQLLSELFTLEVRYLVINHRLTARIVIGDTIVAPYVGRNTGDNKVFFGNAQWDQGSGASIGGIVLDNAIPSNCKWIFTDSDGTLRDLSDLVPGSGVHIRIYY